ncbi:glycosyltransferase family 4 protein [Patescibacteria group bacterium]
MPKFPKLTETFIERDISKLVELGNLDVKVLFLEKGEGKMSEFSSSVSEEARLTWWDSFCALRFFVTKFGRVFEVFFLIKNVYLFLKSVGYAQVFSKYNPDEIHAHFMSEPSTIAMGAATILGVPFSINAHARDVTEYPTLEEEKVKRAKFITVCNTNVFEVCKNFIPGAKNIFKIYHGVSRAELFSSPLTIVKPKRPVIFSGGARLVGKKGHKYLIEAAEILSDKNYDFEVHIAGGGPLHKELQNQVKSSGLGDMVFFHGGEKGVPFDTVSQYYRIADILVSPNIALEEGDVDGIPNALIEAALAKLPIITTDAGSILEFVEHEFNGLVVPQKSSKSLASAIEMLLNDEDLRRELGKNAQSKAIKMFDIERNVRELEKLLLK